MQTQHYGFKLFEAAEKPTWLTDWNTTMNKIDSTIARLSGGGGDTPDLEELTQRVQALEGRVDSDELRLNVVEGDIVDMLQTLSDVQTALSQAQSDIVANKTYSDAQISTLTEDVTDIRTSIGSLTTSLSALSTRVGDCETNITGLDNRITALEGQGTGGGGSPYLGVIAFYNNTLMPGMKKGDLLITYNSTLSSPYLKEIASTGSSDSYLIKCASFTLYRSASVNYPHTFYVLTQDIEETITLNGSYALALRPTKKTCPIYGLVSTSGTVATHKGDYVSITSDYKMNIHSVSGNSMSSLTSTGLLIHEDALSLPNWNVSQMLYFI